MAGFAIATASRPAADGGPGMDKSKLFLTSCISLVTTSMVFAIRGDIADPLMKAFHITNQQQGLVFSPAFWAFTIAIFIGGAIADTVGMKTLHVLSSLGYIAGVLLVIFAPRPAMPTPAVLTTPEYASLFDNLSTTLLYTGFFIMGLSQGLVEAVINPLIVTIYSDQKTRRLTMLHAWWPGGQVIGGLLAVAMTTMLNASWQLKLATILVPAVVYLLLAMSLKYPQTERVTSNVSTAEMWKQAAQPLFLLLFVCMWMTAAAELGPDQWFPKVMGALVPQLSPSAGSGVVFLVYTAGLMFVLRTFGSAISHKSPIATLIFSSILTGVGLYWLGGLDKTTSAVTALTAATLFGIGKTYFWPTMLGVTSEQFPRGGALLISLMGGAGMLSVAVALPIMGDRIDKYGPGAALQLVAWLGLILTIIFSGVWFYFKARGGYRVVHISEPAVGK
jgi:MFS family permease